MPTNNVTTDNTAKNGSILADTEIWAQIEAKELWIEPMITPQLQIHSCKVDLRLSGKFWQVKHFSLGAYDPLNPPPKDYRREITLPLGHPYIIHPGDFLLASTYENLSLPSNLLGIIQGRSSLGRLGIIVHATAAFVDPHFSGELTLELSNLGHLPVKLYPLSRVASIVFVRVYGVIKAPYGSEIQLPELSDQPVRLGKYGSSTSEESRIGEDLENRLIGPWQEDKPRSEGAAFEPLTPDEEDEFA